MSNTLLAQENDGEEILKILEQTPTKGNLELIYTRRPNAYSSYKKESEESKVFVVKEQDRIIGTVVQVPHDVYMQGEKIKSGYVCGYKKDQTYQDDVRWGKEFIRNLVDENIDVNFCSIVEENSSVQNMFEKKRKNTMNMEYITTYTTYMLSPNMKIDADESKYIFKQVSEEDEKQVLDFFDSQGKKHNMFPVINDLNQFPDLTYKDFYILKNGQDILSVGALWNQTKYRQYVVRKYKGIMKAVKILNPILKKMGYIRLPKENETMDFPMLSFFISKEDNEEYYKVFLKNICKVIKKKYTMFVIGTTQEYFANDIYMKLKNIHFKTKIYNIEFMMGKEKKAKLDSKNIWLECGML